MMAFIGFFTVCWLIVKHLSGPNNGDLDEDYQRVEHLYKNYQDYLQDTQVKK